jgi:hypothetical protein
MISFWMRGFSLNVRPLASDGTRHPISFRLTIAPTNGDDGFKHHYINLIKGLAFIIFSSFFDFIRSKSHSPSSGHHGPPNLSRMKGRKARAAAAEVPTSNDERLMPSTKAAKSSLAKFAWSGFATLRDHFS